MVFLVLVFQSTDLVSMVYSCIGAEIQDSDASSAGDVTPSDQDLDEPTAVSDAPADRRTNGHVGASKQTEPGRQDRTVLLTDMEDEGHGGDGGGVAIIGPKPEPPPQSSKPSLAVMRQRHLQESLGTANTFCFYTLSPYCY